MPYLIANFCEHDSDIPCASVGCGTPTEVVYVGPRRCPTHPNVVIGSPCGQFDGVCGACEALSDDYGPTPEEIERQEEERENYKAFLESSDNDPF